ncbi:hypothetical protein P9W99_05950 [Bacillus cereus]|uniref:Uncharacterized protein n=1 Tax=Bacillus cereus ISP2954 TaxID=1053215 RepID=A0A9W5QLW2_BACCE|nr:MULTISPECIES: hypothetical protein [Bacillus cereus group]AGE75957.1 hypothetical protein HD73_0377 [Bacillus thuringiensis serovar kurstaki str. HD73]AIE31537.1 hypothetical protein BTK_02045 [Bacillus thuringiensis serovar kurstaki str. HD-1]AJK39315.1 hypothetical protein BG08_5659 [Bacillus thuringiensis serovar kurstaki]AKJ59038.1 hypothetical protein XI92_12305 [Bacillus thuringiensis]ALL61732.1 hypothetical protein AQ980_29115 [Bacillus thuringiensis]
MKISNKMFILISIGIIILLFIRGLYNSIKLGDSEFGIGYVFGQAVGGTLAWFSIIALIAALVFLIIGFINKKKNNETKPLFVRSAISFGTSIVSFVVLFVIIFITMGIENDHKAVALEQKKESEYLMAAANFYNDIDSFEWFSTTVLSGYSTTWSEAINNRKDFNVEIISKKTESDKMIKHAELLYSEMGQQLKVISKAAKEQPEQYKELYDEYKKIYSIVTALNEQVNSPTGSLISFNQNVNSLLQEYKKAKGNIDIAITEDIKNKSEQIKEANNSTSNDNDLTKY